MTEHPKITDSLGHELRFAIYKDPLSQGITNRQINALVARAAPILWREWTRGMAVVPLPEPYEGDFRLFPAGIALTALSHASGPRVDVDFGSYGCDWPVEVARQIFAAGLAVCDQAEKLTADATGVTP